MEPKTKGSKLDDGVFVLNKLKGRIEVHIQGFSECHEGHDEEGERVSEPVRIRGFEWTLCASPVTNNENGIEFYIKCDGGSRGSDWKCEASVILRCTSGGKEVEMGRLDDVKFNETSNGARMCEVSII